MHRRTIYLLWPQMDRRGPDSGIPPYETPIATQSAENEKLVLQWAEEYVRLRENGEELWRFFEKKIKNLRKLEQK